MTAKINISISIQQPNRELTINLHSTKIQSSSDRMIFLLILIFCVSCCVIHFTAMLLLRIFLALRCAFVIRVGFVKNLQAFFVEMYSYTSCKKCKFLLNCLLHKRTSIAEKKPNQLKQTLFLLKKEKKNAAENHF